MSYFIPIARTLKPLKGDLSAITWPAASIVRAELQPPDLFGVAEDANPREVVVQGVAGQGLFFDANTGRSFPHSDAHLARARSAFQVLGDVQLTIEGTTLAAYFTAANVDGVHEVAQWIEFYFCAFLSLTSGVYVAPRRIYGSISDVVEFNYELAELRAQTMTLRSDVRDRAFELARDFADIQDDRSPRLIVAALYYRQACRLRSPRQVTVPLLNISEAIMNLAKAIEVLLGGTSDAIRNEAAKLNFTSDEVESQIVPILLVRHQLDIAHAAARRLSPSQLQTLISYCERAKQNVRAVLLKAALMTQNGTYTPRPLEDLESVEREKVALLNKLQEHLAHPPLNDDLFPGTPPNTA